MQATVIDPADVGALEAALNQHNVSGDEKVLCILILTSYNMVHSALFFMHAGVTVLH